MADNIVPNTASSMGSGVVSEPQARSRARSAGDSLVEIARAKAAAASEPPHDKSAANAEAARIAGWQGPGRR